MKKYENNEITFFPPQIYELTRLTKFNNINDLAEFSINRQVHDGVRTWLPKFVKIDRKSYIVLPGMQFLFWEKKLLILYKYVEGDDQYHFDEINNDIISKHSLIHRNRFLRTKINNDQVKYTIDSNTIFKEKH